MKKNIFKFLSAAALVGVTTLSLTSCKVVDTIKGWFDDDQVETTKPVETTPPTTDGDVIVDGKEVKDGSKINIPSKLSFRKASANTEGITVNATVLPENATNKELSWTLAWAESVSLGIQGVSDPIVTDYISIEVSEDTFSCKIKCIKPFTYKAYIRVRSSSSGIYRDISIDFASYINVFKLNTYVNDNKIGTAWLKYDYDNEKYNFAGAPASKLFYGFNLWNSVDQRINDHFDYETQNFDDVVFSSYFGTTIDKNYKDFKSNNGYLGTTGCVYVDLYGNGSNCLSDSSGNFVRTFSEQEYSLYGSATDYFSLSLSNEVKECLQNNELYEFIKPIFREYEHVYFYMDDFAPDKNLFNLFFDTDNMHIEDADEIISLLAGIYNNGGSILNLYIETKTFNVEYSERYDADFSNCLRSQCLDFDFSIPVLEYVNVTDIIVDNSTIVES